MEWYYSNNGQQAGPVSQDQLAELFRNGTVKPFDLVWNETMTEWTAIGKVEAFASVASAPAAAPAPASFDSPPPISNASPYLAAAAPMAASPLGAAPSGTGEPPTYLWQAIVVTVLCCIPFGIPAIVFSTKVKPAYLAGDYAGALEASKKAKMWCIVALIVGLITNLLVFGLQILVGINSASQSYQ
jgi:hypothetical protein